MPIVTIVRRCFQCITLTWLLSGHAWSQNLMLCLSPAPPVYVASSNLLDEYRSEIIADYERFFAEATQYIACIDLERATTMEHLRRTSQELEELVNNR